MKDVLPHALWITPNFSTEMEMGIVPPPRVDHDKVDWEGFLAVLEAKFQAKQQGVNMRLCDDTIDQVTIHMKECGELPGTIECLEFGAALQDKAKRSKKSIVPIRSEWSTLHYLEDRKQAPPPVMLPLVLSGQVDDIVLFVNNIRLHLGIKFAGDVMGMIMQTPIKEEDHQGHLSPDLLELFESHFGLAYKSYAVITPLVKIDPSKI